MASIFPSAGTGRDYKVHGVDFLSHPITFTSGDTLLNGYLVPDVDRTVKHMQTPRLKIDSKIAGCLSDFPSFRGFPRNFSA